MVRTLIKGCATGVFKESTQNKLSSLQENRYAFQLEKPTTMTNPKYKISSL